MKRYLLFAGDNYYPGGGWKDFVDDCDDKKEAELFIKHWSRKSLTGTWAHVVDSHSGKIVKSKDD